MIDTVLNLLFRCSHRRLSRPVSPPSKKGVSQGPAYVVCLDCGKHFEYDTHEMRLGKRLDDREGAPDHDPLAPAPKPPRSKLKFALWAGLPLAVLLGSLLKSRKPHAAAPKPQAQAKPAPAPEYGRDSRAPS
jgi:hypothetical protein